MIPMRGDRLHGGVDDLHARAGGEGGSAGGEGDESVVREVSGLAAAYAFGPVALGAARQEQQPELWALGVMVGEGLEQGVDLAEMGLGIAGSCPRRRGR